MIDQGAPETEIDAYIREEGVTLSQLQNSPHPKSKATRDITVTFNDGSAHVYENTLADTTPEQVTERAEREFGLEVVSLDGGRKPTQGKAKASPHAAPSPDARSAILSVLPQAEVTSWKRSPNSSLGRANPNSWHNRSGGAVDIRPIPGMTFEEAKQALEDAGYPIIEAIDEVKNPSAHATGAHWHFTLGDRPEAPETQEDGLSIDDSNPLPSPSRLDQPPSNARPVKAPQNTTATQAGVFGFADALTFGFGDEIDAGIGTVLGGDGYKTIWDGSSLSDAYGANVAQNRELLKDAFDENTAAYIGGGLASALIPVGAAGKAITGGKGIVNAVRGTDAAAGVTKGARLAKAAKDGAIAGGVYGLGSDEGGLTERLDGAAIGAAGGAVASLGLQKAMQAGGKALAPVGERLFPKIAQSRFEAKQALNKYAKQDAAISSDVETILKGLTGSDGSTRKQLTKGQQSALLSRLDDLETSYMPTAEVKALDLPPSVKAKLNVAMAKRHLLSDKEVAALADGTPHGDAVSEGIARARRLRTIIPEGSSNSNSGVRWLAEAIGSTAGYKLAGPFGGAAGSLAGRALSKSQTNEAAAKAAEIAAKSRAFAKMPQETLNTPSARERLMSLANGEMDAPYLQTQESNRLAEEGRKVATSNARDNVKPSGGWRGLIYDRTGLLPADQDAGALTALKDGAISPEQFDAFLNSPDKLMEGNAGNALVDRLSHLADNGKLNRDPSWAPLEVTPATPIAPMVDAKGAPIRSLPAYQAGAAKNIARELQLLKALDELDPVQVELADGSATRASELGLLNTEEAAKVRNLRAELTLVKPEGAKR